MQVLGVSFVFADWLISDGLDSEQLAVLRVGQVLHWQAYGQMSVPCGQWGRMTTGQSCKLCWRKQAFQPYPSYLLFQGSKWSWFKNQCYCSEHTYVSGSLDHQKCPSYLLWFKIKSSCLSYIYSILQSVQFLILIISWEILIWSHTDLQINDSQIKSTLFSTKPLCFLLPFGEIR